MQHFVIVITSDRLFNEEHHPKFFEYLLTKPRSVRISDDAFCFQAAEGISLVRSQLESHLKENDEFVLFQVSRAVWSAAREGLDERLIEVFRPSA